jgi:hypothetical protein
MKPIYPELDESWVFCPEHLPKRFVRLGVDEYFQQCDREFKDVGSAAGIIRVEPKTLRSTWIAEHSIAWVKIGGKVWVHIPSSEVLLCSRKPWELSLNCPEYHEESKNTPRHP